VRHRRLGLAARSTLVNDILLAGAGARAQHGATATRRAATTGSTGIEHLDKVVDIDQSPIGRTPRLEPGDLHRACSTLIRDLFAAAARGQGPRLRSGAVLASTSRAAAARRARATASVEIEMHFLPDVYVPCETCKGTRYNRDTLEVALQGQDRSPMCSR
jgi:excinuclease ABC subunit A